MFELSYSPDLVDLVPFVLFQMIAAIVTYLIIVLNFDNQPK